MYHHQKSLDLNYSNAFYLSMLVNYRDVAEDKYAQAEKTRGFFFIFLYFGVGLESPFCQLQAIYIKLFFLQVDSTQIL
jgi:hypothetical protein